MATGGRVLIIEHVIPEDNGPHIAKFMDVNMLINTTGRERSRREFEQLLSSAGLTLRQLTPTSIGICVLECAAS